MRRRATSGTAWALLAAAVAVAACTRAAPSDSRAPAAPPELARLPAGAIAVVRLDVTGPTGEAVAAAVRGMGDERLACLAGMLTSLDRLAVAFVPRGRDFAAALLLDGAVTRREVEACGADLARTFASRPLPEGATPAFRAVGPAGEPADDAADEDRRGSWLVAVDLETERAPLGVRGPLAQALGRLARHPLVLGVLGGEALRTMSGLAATYLPLSSMGEAADRIVALAYGITPLPDGSATVRVEVELTDERSARNLARQVTQVGRIAALEGEKAAWNDLRGMVRGLVARVGDGGRRVEIDGVLTPEGWASLLR